MAPGPPVAARGNQIFRELKGSSMEQRMKLGDYLVACSKRSLFLTYSGYRVIWSLISFLNSGGAKGSISSHFPMGQESVSLAMVMRGTPARLATVCMTYGAGGHNMVNRWRARSPKEFRSSLSAAARENRSVSSGCSSTIKRRKSSCSSVFLGSRCWRYELSPYA